MLQESLKRWEQSLREEGHKRGKDEGFAEGHKRGKDEGLMEVARNLKKMGMDLQIISKATGLTVEEIDSL